MRTRQDARRGVLTGFSRLKGFLPVEGEKAAENANARAVAGQGCA